MKWGARFSKEFSNSLGFSDPGYPEILALIPPTSLLNFANIKLALWSHAYQIREGHIVGLLLSGIDFGCWSAVSECGNGWTASSSGNTA